MTFDDELPQPWEAYGSPVGATVWSAGRRNRICCIDDVAEPLVIARLIAALPEIVAAAEQAIVNETVQHRGNALTATLLRDALARAGLR